MQCAGHDLPLAGLALKEPWLNQQGLKPFCRLKWASGRQMGQNPLESTSPSLLIANLSLGWSEG
jgi:hypothetical protein